MIEKFQNRSRQLEANPSNSLRTQRFEAASSGDFIKLLTEHSAHSVYRQTKKLPNLNGNIVIFPAMETI
jgi:hypothetical protein